MKYRAQSSRLRLLIALGVGSGFWSACRMFGAAEPPEAAPPPPVVAEIAPKRIEPGQLPSAPLPHGSVAPLPSLQVAVTDWLRGDAAWQSLRSASIANEPARDGWEYVLVRLQLTGVAPQSWVGCRDFRVIGADRIAYFHGAQIPPAPALEYATLAAEQNAEGWCAYAVHAGERNLLLMINEPDDRDPDALRYVALEEGAAIEPASIAVPNPPQSAGDAPLSAAALGREVVTQEWTLKAVEMLRGEAAQHLVESANSRNKPPAEGLEYVAAKIHARYHGPDERPGLLSPSQFRAIDGKGEPYETPIVLDVFPDLTRTLLPGGEHTGWVVLQVAPGDSGAVLRFQPYYPDRALRYLALVEGGAQASPDGNPVESSSAAIPAADPDVASDPAGAISR